MGPDPSRRQGRRVRPGPASGARAELRRRTSATAGTRRHHPRLHERAPPPHAAAAQAAGARALGHGPGSDRRQRRLALFDRDPRPAGPHPAPGHPARPDPRGPQGIGLVRAPRPCGQARRHRDAWAGLARHGRRQRQDAVPRARRQHVCPQARRGRGADRRLEPGRPRRATRRHALPRHRRRHRARDAASAAGAVGLARHGPCGRARRRHRCRSGRRPLCGMPHRAGGRHTAWATGTSCWSAPG